MSESRFDAYMRWQKFIFADRPRLRKGIRRPTLIAFCLVLASYGQYGLGSGVANSTIADDIGIDRDYLGKYRNEAVRLGWFKPTGRYLGRVERLDIAIPGRPSASAPKAPEASPDKPQRHLNDVPSCPLCATLDLPVAELYRLHFGG